MASTPTQESTICPTAYADFTALDLDDDVDAVEVSPEVAASTVQEQPGMRQQKKQKQAVAPGGSDGGVAPSRNRGLGVSQLELLRCGGDQLRARSEAAAVVAGAGASVHHHQHNHLPPPAFNTATADLRRYSSLFVQHHHQTTVYAPAPLRYAYPDSTEIHVVTPEQPFRDTRGRVVHFPPPGNAGLCVLGCNCELCAMMKRALAEQGSRAPAPVAANMPDHSNYRLATAAREEIGQRIHAAPEGINTEIREIQFFPTRATQHAESELPSSSSGDGAEPLDLSLKL